LPRFRRIKGTQDILPVEAGQWQRIEQTIRDTMLIYNYDELRTPVFEQTELFARSIGQATDIVSKEMYTFLDRGKKSLTLKPEMTAPIVRAYLENNLMSANPVSKLYYIAPLFRQENPQAGRLRQFNQFGAEALGAPAPELDIEVILLALEIYQRLQITNLQLVINTVDNPNARETYKHILKEYVEPNLHKYCRDCQKRILTNPLRILDCKVEECRKLNKNAPRLLDHLSTEGQEHFDRVQSYLSANNIDYSINPYMVRGLDYYTHTVFEITSTQLGSQDAICGGGRYDLLAEQLGGPPTAAVGFASGIERLMMVMAAQNLLEPVQKELDIYLCALGDSASEQITIWLQKLRRLGYRTDRDYQNRSIKAQMRDANRQKARIVLILGENELIKRQFSVKLMQTGVQEYVDFNQLESYIADAMRQN